MPHTPLSADGKRARSTRVDIRANGTTAARRTQGVTVVPTPISRHDAAHAREIARQSDLTYAQVVEIFRRLDADGGVYVPEDDVVMPLHEGLRADRRVISATIARQVLELARLMRFNCAPSQLPAADRVRLSRQAREARDRLAAVNLGPKALNTRLAPLQNLRAGLVVFDAPRREHCLVEPGWMGLSIRGSDGARRFSEMIVVESMGVREDLLLDNVDDGDFLVIDLNARGVVASLGLETLLPRVAPLLDRRALRAFLNIVVTDICATLDDEGEVGTDRLGASLVFDDFTALWQGAVAAGASDDLLAVCALAGCPARSLLQRRHKVARELRSEFEQAATSTLRILALEALVQRGDLLVPEADLLADELVQDTFAARTMTIGATAPLRLPSA